MSGGLDADRYRLSEAEHQSIFEKRIIPEYFSGAGRSAHPIAIVYGGQPGAGKTVSVLGVAATLAERGGAVTIIGDKLRNYHPKYGRLLDQDDKTAAFFTDGDTARWIEKSIAYARNGRTNVVIEGTMRDTAKVVQTLTAFRAAGFETDARALAVNARMSELGILERYEQQRVTLSRIFVVV